LRRDRREDKEQNSEMSQKLTQASLNEQGADMPQEALHASAPHSEGTRNGGASPVPIHEDAYRALDRVEAFLCGCLARK
jgi:hypothetical protein